MNQFIHPDPVPKDFYHPQFCFQILHPDYVEMDFEALMSSKDFLRRWSQSDWPSDDFSLEENFKDLDWHYDEQTNKIAFTYTILDSTQSKCLGCLYIRPINSLLKYQTKGYKGLDGFTHYCSYWVIDTIRGTELDHTILRNLQNWLTSTWKFPGVFFTSNQEIPETEENYNKNGLEQFLTLEEPKRHQHCWKLKQGTQNGF